MTRRSITTEIDVDEEVFAHYRYGNIDQVPVQWYVDEYNNVYGENGEIWKKMNGK